MLFHTMKIKFSINRIKIENRTKKVFLNTSIKGRTFFLENTKEKKLKKNMNEKGSTKRSFLPNYFCNKSDTSNNSCNQILTRLFVMFLF